LYDAAEVCTDAISEVCTDVASEAGREVATEFCAADDVTAHAAYTVTVDTDTIWHSAGHQLCELPTGFASPEEERASMAAATRRVLKDMSLSYIVK
jgi:hypothetical protein